MSFGAARSNVPPADPDDSDEPTRRRGRVLIPTIAVIAVIIVLLGLFSAFYTDLLWFQAEGSSTVFTRQLATRIALFIVFAIVMAVAVAASMIVAYRHRPRRLTRTAEQLSLARYREALEPLRRVLVIGIPVVIGILAGISASSEWKTWTMWRNQVPFGQSDPQFGVDVGFFVFTYPWLRYVLGFAFAMVVLAFVAAVVVHYLYGGIRLQPRGERFSPVAQTQLSVLLGLFCILKAVGYWLDRYGLALKSESLGQGFTGLKYRDVHALLPAKSILIGIALICALLLFANAFRRSWQLAGAGLGLMVVAAIVIGGIYPAVVQQFQVRPSEPDKEAASIQNNINSTRAAYGIDKINTTDYDAKVAPDSAVLATQRGTTEAVRIVDPAVVSPTFRNQQQYRSFYSFPDTLNVDRYAFKGKQNGGVVAVRELKLAGLSESQRNWANDHLVYTHGYGFVAAYDNEKAPNGDPKFFESNIPSQGELVMSQPRIYFGENSPQYSIVGGAENDEARELDYPDDTATNGQRNNTYDGTGGVAVGSAINRLLFAVKFQEPNILLSGLINDKSRIMWDRDPLTMVGKVAPWLRLDTDPYPVVVDGRVKWIVDGYSTTNDYPFSTRATMSDAQGTAPVAGALSTGTGFVPPRDELNYIRNSVKAVVDAFDGSVNLYAWDESDPILRTWSNAFPGTVQPKAAMPEAIMAHVRYPEDAFALQRYMFARYHVTDPGAFYSGQDFWTIPTDPTNKSSSEFQPPYYLSMQMPNESVPQFSLTTTYAPNKRQTLAGFMRVNCAPGPDFGKFEVLRLPPNSTIPGPVQVQNSFESDPTISQQLSLWRKGGSEVELGNLLSLPVGSGILYVEPLYVRATQDGYPLLQRVMAGFGDKVAMRDTLPEALSTVLGVGRPSGGGSGGKPGPAPATSALADLEAALSEAQAAYNAGQQALKDGDFAAYGEAQKRLAAALEKAEAARRRLGSATAAPTPSPSPSVSPAAARLAPLSGLSWADWRGFAARG